MKFAASKKLTLVRISLLTLVTFTISGVYYATYIYGADLSGRLLKETISLQSDGNYQIDYLKLDVSLVDKELHITDLILEPTSGNINQSRTYKIRIPDLKIKLGSLYNLYWKKELAFRRIAVTDPEIYILKTDSASSKTTLSLESGDLYKLINQYLFKFSIDSLGIQNAMINYDSQVGEELHLMLRNIDFGIRNLAIDSVKTNSKFLYTDDIQLILNNQTFHLADSLHTLRFDKFELSTKKQDIVFKNLSIKEKSPKRNNLLNSYDVEIPEINFKGIDFQRAYTEDNLHLDTVRLMQPRISVTKRNDSKFNQKDLPKLFFRLFNEVKVGRFFINDGMVNLKVDQEDQHQLITSKKLNVSIKDFVIDSTHLNNPLEVAYFDHFSLSTNDLTIMLPDSSHLITVSTINASSLDSTLNLINVRLKPHLDRIDSQQIRGNLPSLSLVGLDYSKAWLLKRITARKLTLNHPDFDLVVNTQNDSTSAISIVKSIVLDTVKIVRGSAKTRSLDWTLTLEQLNAVVSNVNIDENTKINNLHRAFRSQKITSDQLRFVSDQYELNFKHFHSSPLFKNSSLTDITFLQSGDAHPLIISGATIEGFILDSLFEKQRLIFDTLRVKGPVVNINLDQKRNMNQDKINDFIHKVSFNRVLISKGHVNVYKHNELFSHLDSVSIALTSFHYDSTVNEYFTGIDFHADTFHISMPDIHHGLSGRSITVSQKDSTLDIYNLVLTPYDSDSAFNHYNIISRELKVQFLDFHKLVNTGEIEFRSGILRSPKLDIIVETDSPKKEVKNRDPIRFESFNLTDGHLNFQNRITGFSLESHGFNVLVHDFDILNDTSLFHAKNYLFNAKRTTLGIKKLNDSIRIGNAQVNSTTGHLIFNDINYEHDRNLLVDVKRVELKGLNTDHLIDQNKIVMDSLLLYEPHVRFGLASSKSANENPPKIEIGGIRLSNGFFKLFREDLNQGDTIAINQFALNVNRFNYDSSAQIKFSHHLFESLDFSGSSFTYQLPDALNMIEVEAYSYDHISKKIVLDEVKYSPLFNRGEYQTKIDYQKDWIDGSVRQFRIEGFEMDSLISNQKIQATHITINQLELDTHRDKRLPKEPEIYKPLPQSLLKAIPYRVSIDSISVESSYISHSEFSENGELPGQIFFKNINANLGNITNDPAAVRNNNAMSFRATGSLMNTGNFNLFSKFYLADSLDTYELNGRIGTMELTELNRFLEHTAFVLIRDGKSQEATFKFEGNENYSLGEMTFYYTDLKINVLDQNSVDSPGFSSAMKTFFANTFVVNTKNPHFIFVRDGDIFHERDQSKSIFNYWAKSLLSGVVSSIGAKNNKKTIRQQNEEIQVKFDKMKKGG